MILFNALCGYLPKVLKSKGLDEIYLLELLLKDSHIVQWYTEIDFPTPYASVALGLSNSDSFSWKSKVIRKSSG